MSEKNTVVTEDTVTFELEVGYTDADKVVHKEVELREITGFDEEAISKQDVRSNVGKLITTLLANVVVRIGTIGFKDLSRPKWEKIFKELPMGDRDALMLEIRKMSNGNEIELDMKCPHCKAKIMHIVEIDTDVEIQPLDADVYSIPFELPKGIKNKKGELCKTGTIRLPNGVDQETLDSIARKNPGMANTNVIARTVNEIDGFGKVGLSDIRSMTVRDRDYLIKLMGEFAYGPKFEISFPCPSCMEDVETGIHPVNFI